MTKVSSLLDLYKVVEPLLTNDVDVNLYIYDCDLRKKKQVTIHAHPPGRYRKPGEDVDICLERNSVALNMLHRHFRILPGFDFRHKLMQDDAVQRYRKLKLLIAS